VPASIEVAKHTLLSCGLILAIGTLASMLAQKIRIPDVAVFLVTGIAIGSQALGLVHIGADSALNQIILLFGASYILFDGGASLRLNVLKQVWITIVVIATVGVLITTAITGVAAHYILGVPMMVAFRSVRRWPRPIRRRRCRSSARSTSATASRRP
jgi:cell volume regulation protein A